MAKVNTDAKPKNTGQFGAGNKGKPKGAVNKTTGALKEMILGALDHVGGVQYLVERANDPKTQPAFMQLVGKVLPMTVAGDSTSPLVVEIVSFANKSSE